MGLKSFNVEVLDEDKDFLRFACHNAGFEVNEIEERYPYSVMQVDSEEDMSLDVAFELGRAFEKAKED